MRLQETPISAQLSFQPLPKQGTPFNTFLASANVSFPWRRLFLSPPLQGPAGTDHPNPSSYRVPPGCPWIPLRCPWGSLVAIVLVAFEGHFY